MVILPFSWLVLGYLYCWEYCELSLLDGHEKKFPSTFFFFAFFLLSFFFLFSFWGRKYLYAYNSFR